MKTAQAHLMRCSSHALSPPLAFRRRRSERAASFGARELHSPDFRRVHARAFAPDLDKDKENDDDDHLTQHVDEIRSRSGRHDRPGRSTDPDPGSCGQGRPLFRRRFRFTGLIASAKPLSANGAMVMMPARRRAAVPLPRRAVAPLPRAAATGPWFRRPRISIRLKSRRSRPL